jgi:L-serine dehydratase
MNILFDSFEEWEKYCEEKKVLPYVAVLEYEMKQKNRSEEEIWSGLARAFQVMTEAVKTGLNEDMRSRSGMIDNGAKRVKNASISVLGDNFQQLVYNALAAKEVNSCMGRIVAAPTAGASGIMPGVLTTLQNLHNIPNQKIYEAMLVSAGIGLIIERKASIAGAVGGCQAETGTAAAMASGAVVYCLGGDLSQIFDTVAITIQCMLGLICDPVAGLVEVPCVIRNASAAAIAFSSAQMALAGLKTVIPVDEVIDAMGEVGASMESKYKETALGGLAATKTAKIIEKKVLVSNIEILPDDTQL